MLGTNNSCIILVRIYEALPTKEGKNSFQLKLNIKSLEKLILYSFFSSP